MNVALVPGDWLPVAGAALIAALGLAVLLVRPVGPMQRAFAVFAVAFGLGSGLSNLTDPADPGVNDVLWWGVTVLYGLAAAALLAFVAALAGRPQGLGGWAAAALPAGVLAVVACLPLLQGEGVVRALFGSIGVAWTPAAIPSWIAFAAFHALAWAGAGWIALQARDADAKAVHQAGLTTSALVVYPAFFAGSIALLPDALARSLGVTAILGAAWLAVVWLAHLPSGAARSAARTAAWLPAAVMVAGFLLDITRFPAGPGLSRIAMVAVLAYAILRHQALGIDAKLRFGISKGSVAGLFIAVVLVATEGAQALVGGENEWIGIAAAGLLVFALTPLQRAADRLAEAAVPRARTAAAGAVANGPGRGSPQGLAGGSGVAPAPAAARDASDPLQDYRAAYRAAARDAPLGAEEELALARIARRLGLDPEAVVRVRLDAEAARRAQ